MQLLIQEFLKTRTFGELSKIHGVYASFDQSGYKWSTNYDMIEAKDSDELACQCRGLVLSTVDGHSLASQAKEINGKLNYDDVCPGETKILACSFFRFFNEGQGSAAKIDWNDPSIKVEQKLDGSLTCVYYDPFSCKWCVCTRSVSEANIPLDNGLFTFRTLFEKAVFDTCGMTFDQFTEKLVKGITYMFELTSPYTRIVVNYNNTNITLLGARYIASLQEVDPTQLNIGIPCVKTYALNSLQDIFNYVSAQNPLEHEGVVVKDINFNRVKIKNINYVLLNKSRDSVCNDRAFLGLVLNDKIDDVFPILPPEFQNRTLELKEKYLAYIDFFEKEYQIVAQQAQSKKDFALAIQAKKLWGAPSFKLFDKKVLSFKDFITKSKSDDGSFSNTFLDNLLNTIDI